MGGHQKYFCEQCNRKVSHKDVHEQSIGHKRYKDIMLWWKDPEETLQTIADRLLVSRERVRQIINGYFSSSPPGAFIQKHREERHWARVAARCERMERLRTEKPHMKALIAIGARQNMPVVPINKNVAMVNGVKCWVKRGCTMGTESNRYIRTGGALESAPFDMEFFLVNDPVIPEDWWIFPADKIVWGTSWCREKELSPYFTARRREHKTPKYREFLNAWYLLKEQSNVPRPGTRNKPKVQAVAGRDGKWKRQGAGFRG